MRKTKTHLKLQEMFPELKDSEPVEEWSVSSYNDGGRIVTTIWEGPGRHTRTQYNDWSVEHPDTSIQVVERYQHREWRFRDKSPRKTYGTL